jgi:hypothetical protein
LKLFLLVVGRIMKRKKREKHTEAFFPGPEPDTPCWLCWARLLHLLGAIKADLRVSLWNSSPPNVVVVIILARSNQNYPCGSNISRTFLKSQSLGDMTHHFSCYTFSSLALHFL